jgi:hypothetical protein
MSKWLSFHFPGFVKGLCFDRSSDALPLNPWPPPEYGPQVSRRKLVMRLFLASFFFVFSIFFSNVAQADPQKHKSNSKGQGYSRGSSKQRHKSQSPKRYSAGLPGGGYQHWHHQHKHQ